MFEKQDLLREIILMGKETMLDEIKLRDDMWPASTLMIKERRKKSRRKRTLEILDRLAEMRAI